MPHKSRHSATETAEPDAKIASHTIPVPFRKLCTKSCRRCPVVRRSCRAGDQLPV